MATSLETGLQGYGQALRQRTRYLIDTGRLSATAGLEMDSISHQLDGLDAALSTRCQQLGGPVETMRAVALDAYAREVKRRGQLVVVDVRQTRLKGRGLRERLRLTRREAVRGRLRLVTRDAGVDLERLERIARRWSRAG